METICIAGKNDIAVRALYFLYDHYPHYRYCVVPNQTDDGVNRWQPSLKFHAGKLGVEVVTLPDLYPQKDLIFLSLEFDSIIKPERFQSNRLHNIHFSALPKFKGMYTSVHPILCGESYSGVTLHLIDAGIDTGDIIDQVVFPIDVYTTARDLYMLYLKHSFPLLTRNLDDILQNTFRAEKQAPLESSYYSKKSIDFSNIRIDLNKTGFEISKQFRAFTFQEYQLPHFGGWAIYKTELTLEKSPAKPGTVIQET